MADKTGTHWGRADPFYRGQETSVSMAKIKRHDAGSGWRRAGTYLPGQSGNPDGARSRQRRHAALMRQHARDLGGLSVLSVADRQWLAKAVDLLMRRPSSDEDRIRYLNTAARLIDGIRERQLKRRRRRRPSALDALTLVGANDAGAQ